MPLNLKQIINPGEADNSAPSADSLLAEAKLGPRDGAGKTVVVAMSGGVDSAVTALIMRERGYRVIGMNLRLFSPDHPEHSANPCCGIPAMDDARATCALIGVPFYAINMESEFGEHVIERFVNEYAAGRTPNPCLECNRHVKFRHLVRRARMLGADCLATGHYARIIPGNPELGVPHRLYRAVDQRKDQSYVLFTLDQEQLAFITFPLGNLTKPEVRQLARTFGLPVAEKAESQEICFVGKGSYADFVARRRPDVARPGDVVNVSGETIGRHAGLVHHTIGQRKGIGIARPEPLYVLRLDQEENRLVVGSRDDATAEQVEASGVTWTSGMRPRSPLDCQAAVRYRGVAVPVTITSSGPDSSNASIHFPGEQPIAAPGQAIVFYDGDEVLGGGTIQRIERSWERAALVEAATG